ncbi:hypothetical protein NE237_020742 [Protea cynaroides]|uniref:MADS-box domain-containing protein n=1 Tax=Protea cynaroides TaxID=273540 RepID=A0A9Q0H6P3_9MAGN|nr:hypothetical protein NE237_020742 [Protea cynaroides]
MAKKEEMDVFGFCKIREKGEGEERRVNCRFRIESFGVLQHFGLKTSTEDDSAGKKRSTTTNSKVANSDILAPAWNLSRLICVFSKKDLRSSFYGLLSEIAMGKRKIEIELIEDKQKRIVTFSKRRKGLFHKASELQSLCNVQTAIVVFSPAGNPFTSVSDASSLNAIIQRYLNNISSGDESFNAVGVTYEAEETKTVKENDGFWWKTIDADKNCSMEDLLSLKNRLERLRENLCCRLNKLTASSSSQ